MVNSWCHPNSPKINFDLVTNVLNVFHIFTHRSINAGKSGCSYSILFHLASRKSIHSTRLIPTPTNCRLSVMCVHKATYFWSTTLSCLIFCYLTTYFCTCQELFRKIFHKFLNPAEIIRRILRANEIPVPVRADRTLFRHLDAGINMPAV